MVLGSGVVLPAREILFDAVSREGYGALEETAKQEQGSRLWGW